MTLPASGALSMSAINTEFALGTNLGAYRGVTWYTDAGASGTFTSTNLGMNQFYSKRKTSPSFSFTIASNTTNANLRSLAVAAGWNQSSAVVATINSGVTVYSTSTGTPALTINGSFPGGVQLVNNGVILGRGGNGGSGAAAFAGSGEATAGTAGGLALSVSVAVSINNVNRIAGGGGGGGGGGRNQVFVPKQGTYFAPGGGGGGGINFGSGGSGGAAGNGGGPGGGGGTGTLTAAGSGGAGGSNPPATGSSGGNGGSYGSAGSAATGGSGAAGGCITGNANITWIAFGTRNGGIS